MAAVALSLLVLTTFALVLGAYWLSRRGGKPKQVLLMLVLAVVLAVNVAIWAMPTTGGQSLAGSAAVAQ